MSSLLLLTQRPGPPPPPIPPVYHLVKAKTPDPLPPSAADQELWNPEVGVYRDHKPPPEMIYESLEAAIEATKNWALHHGVCYFKQKTAASGSRALMVCNKRGAPRDRPRNQRPGASCIKTGCKMQFWLIALDHANLEGPWKVQHCVNGSSVPHNHPPEADRTAFSAHRRRLRTDEMRQKLKEVYPHCKGPKEAHMIIMKHFPASIWTRQDVRNEITKMKKADEEARIQAEAQVQEMRAAHRAELGLPPLDEADTAPEKAKKAPRSKKAAANQGDKPAPKQKKNAASKQTGTTAPQSDQKPAVGPSRIANPDQNAVNALQQAQMMPPWRAQMPMPMQNQMVTPVSGQVDTSRQHQMTAPGQHSMNPAGPHGMHAATPRTHPYQSWSY